MSILNQQFTDWELLIVDDGSTDKSLAIVQDILTSCKQNNKVRIIEQKHAGCTQATDTGIKEASAPYVTIVDSDDAIYPDALSTLVTCLYKHASVGFMWSKFSCGLQPLSYTQVGWSKDLPSGYKNLLDTFLYTGWWGGQHLRAIKRSIYLDSCQLDPSILYAVDLQLAAIMASTGCDTLFINKILYWYRRHNSHITGKHHVEQKADHTKIIHHLKQQYRNKDSNSKHFSLAADYSINSQRTIRVGAMI